MTTPIIDMLARKSLLFAERYGGSTTHLKTVTSSLAEITDTMTNIQYLQKRIDYHINCKARAKKKKVKDRHQKRIKHFEKKRAIAEMMDLIGATDGQNRPI